MSDINWYERFKAVQQENRELKNKIADLRRHNEQLTDLFLQVSGSEGVTAKYQRQRDELRNEIRHSFNRSIKAHQASTGSFEGLQEIMTELFEKGYPQTHLVTALLICHNRVAELLRDRYDRPKATLVQQPGDDEIGFYQTQIDQIVELSESTAHHRLMKTLLITALEWSAHPALICDTIIRSLQRSGEVDVMFLEALPDQWIESNVPDAPSKLDTLKEGLEWAAKRLSSGQSRRDFALAEAPGRTTLKRYESWYRAMKQAATASNELLGIPEQKAS